MSNEQFEREKSYRAAMAIAKGMLSKGLISKKEYSKIDTIFKEKYAPPLGSLYCKMDLIYT